ncbi:MAG: glycosyltransferase, partial [Prevotella sp.]|nr:glycosyltransferase [Prevotella sp.]
MITFAIVTITYNAAHCLKRTVDSVMQQTYPHINHYIVDGKSKDDTVAMALEYQKASDLAANGHKVVVKSEADRGLYDAMNKGLSMAKGDYIVFLNAGDFLPSADTIDTIISQAHLDDIPSRQWPGVIYGDTD